MYIYIHTYICMYLGCTYIYIYTYVNMYIVHIYICVWDLGSKGNL